MKKLYTCVLTALLLMPAMAYAGADLEGKVTDINIRGGNNALRYNVDVEIIHRSGEKTLRDYCLDTWGGRFVAPMDHPSFPYWYDMLISKDAAEYGIKIANISHFDGATSCDLKNRLWTGA